MIPALDIWRSANLLVKGGLLILLHLIISRHAGRWRPAGGLGNRVGTDPSQIRLVTAGLVARGLIG